MEDQSIVRGELKHGEITDLVLEAFFRVYNELGYGFLEKTLWLLLRLSWD